jgi:hypothetical protein
MTERRAGWLVCGLIAALTAYYLPWFTHLTAGFTTNGFDLAEWTSLHPAVRSSSPPMLTSFLLRFPQWVIVVALALAANGFANARIRWVLRGTAALLALRFFPPIDFFSSAQDDPNYRQMMLLCVLNLLAVLAALGLSRLSARVQSGVLVILLLSGIGAGWIGLSRAKLLLDNFEIAVKIGPGFVGYMVLSVFMIGLIVAQRSSVVWPWQRNVRVTARPDAPGIK